MKAAFPADSSQSRCRRALAAHRQRAREEGRLLDYDLADLEELARTSVQCYWCRMPVAWDFHFDHVLPTARGGAHELANLVVSCGRCNLLKGQLTGAEMQALLSLLAGFHPAASADLSRRLLAGGRRYARPLRGES
jgi:hypothetical protein